MAPKSAAERAKAYRARKRAAGRTDEERAKGRERTRRFRAKIHKDPVLLASLRVKDKHRKRAERKARKAAHVAVLDEEADEPDAVVQVTPVVDSVELPPRDPPATPASIESGASPPNPAAVQYSTPLAYSCKQTLGKAIRRCERALPTCPARQREVVVNLAKKVGVKVIPPLATLPLPLPSEENSSALYSEVIDFYRRNDVSWVSPNKKDRVIIRTKNSRGRTINKTYLQKRFLIMSTAEVYSLFKKENADASIKLTKFRDLRPVDVDIFKHLPQNVCVCKTHENMRYLAVALHPHVGLPLMNNSSNDLVEALTCDSTNKTCMSRQCLICANCLEGYNPRAIGGNFMANTKVSVTQWTEESGWTVQTKSEMTLQECYEKVKQSLRGFLVHVYVKREQSKYFESTKNSVNGRKVAMQVDFAENMSIKHQNEVQSAHWAQRRCSLFTFHIWVGPGLQEGGVIVSDDVTHDKVSVYAFIDMILEHLSQTADGLEEVEIFSDGAASQFKQRFVFSLLHVWESKFGIKIKWNFLASGHGKGVVDGHGATFKGAVWRRCMAGTFLSNAKDVAELGAQICPQLRVVFKPLGEIRALEQQLQEHWDGVKRIKNTQRMHQFWSKGCYIIGSREESSSTESSTQALRKT